MDVVRLIGIRRIGIRRIVSCDGTAPRFEWGRIRIGPETVMSITAEEYRARIERLAALAGDAGLDGVLLTAESNIDYFSGYRHHAPWTLFARPFFEVVGAGGEAVLLAHSFLVPEMERTSAVRDIRAYTKSGGGLDVLLDCLRELGLHRGRLGMELGDEQRLGMTQHEFEALRVGLPGVEIVDAAPLLWRLRMIKSPAEQALMRESAAITARAMAAGFERAGCGVTERDVARAVGEAMMREGAERPGFIMMASGADNHRVLSGKPTDRALEAGDMLWMDLGSVYRGYWSDFCRACVVGGPTGRNATPRRRSSKSTGRASTPCSRVSRCIEFRPRRKPRSPGSAWRSRSAPGASATEWA